jgi:hypothetical protein
VANGLVPQDAPDLSTPETIARSLAAKGLSQWQDMTAALPKRFETALQDAALELEPKTRTVVMPRPSVIRTVAELDVWLMVLRQAIVPHLETGPVLPMP